jgi:peptidoglycan glycosyltransferase
MVGVVTGGTATDIALPGITLAAKTGTAEVGTTNGLTDDWMIAFGPAGTGQTPTIAVAVVLPNQASSATGALESGPVVKAVLASALGAT